MTTPDILARARGLAVLEIVALAFRLDPADEPHAAWRQLHP